MGLAVLVSAIFAYLALKCAPILVSSTVFAVGSFVVSIVIAIIFTKMALKSAAPWKRTSNLIMIIGLMRRDFILEKMKEYSIKK